MTFEDKLTFFMMVVAVFAIVVVVIVVIDMLVDKKTEKISEVIETEKVVERVVVKEVIKEVEKVAPQKVNVVTKQPEVKVTATPKEVVGDPLPVICIESGGQTLLTIDEKGVVTPGNNSVVNVKYNNQE